MAERDIEPLPDQKDAPNIYRDIVRGLIAALLFGLVGLVVLSLLERPIDAGLVAITSAAGGALGGTLIPSSK